MKPNQVKIQPNLIFKVTVHHPKIIIKKKSKSKNKNKNTTDNLKKDK